MGESSIFPKHLQVVHIRSLQFLISSRGILTFPAQAFKIWTDYLFGFSEDDGIDNGNHDDKNFDYNQDTEDND